MEKTYKQHLEDILSNKDCSDSMTGYQNQAVDAMIEILSACPYDELVEILKAKLDDRLVILPCKIGSTVYVLRIEQVPDDEYRMSFHKELRIVSQKFSLSHVDCIGKTVFLNREEAELKLKESNNGK